jgi:hypothetical protein
MSSFFRTVITLFVVASFTSIIKADSPKEKKGSVVPGALAHMPADSVGFVHVRVPDFLKTEMGRAILRRLQKGGKSQDIGEIIMGTKLGLTAADLETLTIFIPPIPAEIEKKLSEGDGTALFAGGLAGWQLLPMVMIKTNGPFDRKKLVRGLIPNVIATIGEPKKKEPAKAAEIPLPALQEVNDVVSFSLLTLGDRTILFGAPNALLRHFELQDRDNPPSPSEVPLRLASEPKPVVAGMYFPKTFNALIGLYGAIGALVGNQVPAEFAFLYPLLSYSKTCAFSLDGNKEATFSLALNARSERTTLLLRESIKNLIAVIELGLDEISAEGRKEKKEQIPPGLMRSLRRSLASPRWEQENKTMQVRFTFQFEPGGFQELLRILDNPTALTSGALRAPAPAPPAKASP